MVLSQKAAGLPAPGSGDVLYLVDLSGYVFRAYHAIAPLSSSKGEPTHAVLGTVNMLQKVVNDRKPAMFAVAMDSRGPSFRKELDERYKANRPPAPPDLKQQMARCNEIVSAYNIPVYQKDGFEADDLIAAVTKRAVADGVQVVIVSADKDLMQLVHDDDHKVVLWDSMRDRVFGPKEVGEKFNVKPSQLRDLLALTGDSSDNVPGVPGVGPKTASDLLNQYGSIDGVYAHVDEIKKAKLKENLKGHEADARLSQKLVSLDASMDIDWDKTHLAYGGANIEELRRLFTELDFTRLRDLLGEPSSQKQAALPNVAPPKKNAPPPAPSPSARTTRTIVDLSELSKVVERAKTLKRIALVAFGTSHDANRAALSGLAIAIEENEGIYVPLSHRYLGVPKQLTEQQVVNALAPLLADASMTVVGHELKYTLIMLALRGAPVSAALFDTMMAAYLLDPEAPHRPQDLAEREFSIQLESFSDAPKQKTKSPELTFEEIEVERATQYAGPFAEVALKLHARLDSSLMNEGLAKLFHEVEMPLTSVLAAVEMEGVLVDVKKLEAVSVRVEKDLKQLDVKAKELAGHEFSIRSRDQLETILFDELKLPVIKKTPKGGRSTDAAVLDELAPLHPLPQVICDYRELDKLKGTYLDALPRAVNPRTGRIHTRYEQAVAATGRLSSMDPNLQNIPIRTEVGREIRTAFIPRKGYEIVSADYSQIELRVLAHLSHDKELLEAFRGTGDIHTHTASLVFEVPKEVVTTEMRRRAKTINFGVIYGMGDSALAKQLGIDRSEAARFIQAYFDRYEGVRRFMERTVDGAKKGEAVRTLLGRRRFLPNLHSANRGLRFEAERVAKNTPIQGTAADIMKSAMVALGDPRVLPAAKMILTVHDELVFEVPTAEVSSAMEIIRDKMATAMVLDVPLVVEVGHGPNWGAAH